MFFLRPTVNLDRMIKRIVILHIAFNLNTNQNDTEHEND